MAETIRDRFGNRYTIRTARKGWRCDQERRGVCVRTIKPGERYVRHVVFPGEIYDRVTVFVECMACAAACEREGVTP